MKNILQIFFDVVHFADTSFCHRDKNEFFRDGVLKHSVERCKNKCDKGNKEKKKISTKKNTQSANVNKQTSTSTTSSAVSMTEETGTAELNEIASLNHEIAETLNGTAERVCLIQNSGDDNVTNN